MRCTPFALLLLATAASGQRLQNDSAAPGGEIAFYPRMQAEESFRVVLDAPPDLGPLLDLVLNAPERRLAPRLTRAWLAQSPSIAAIESRLQRPELDAGVAALLRQTLANRK